MPWVPDDACRCGRWWNSSRVVICRSTTSTTLPPLPPLPPSGPASGLNFSRWIEAQPWPPSPPVACSTARSTNVATTSFFPRVSGHTMCGDLCFGMGASPGRSTRAEHPVSILTRRGGAPHRCAPSSKRLCRSGLGENDVDALAATTGAELHRTWSQREQRVIAAAADVQARVEVGAALANDDLAGRHDLTTEALHAETLSVRVTTVARGARALLVCHGEPAFVLF